MISGTYNIDGENQGLSGEFRFSADDNVTPRFTHISISMLERVLLILNTLITIFQQV